MNDFISRQAAIDAIGEKPFAGIADEYDYEQGLQNQWERDVIAIKILPSAESKRTKGEWIKVRHWGRSYKCNQCGNYLDFDGVNAGRGDANFCPNCGAEMTRGDR